MMKRSEYIREIADLIFACIMGRIGGKERQKLEKWRNDSPENSQLYEKYLSETFVADKFRFVRENDVETAYAELLQKIDGSCRRRRRIFRVCRYAAVVLLLLGFGILFYPYRSTEKQEFPVISPIAPGSYKAILTLSDGERVHISDTAHAAYAGYEKASGPEDSLKYHTITIPRGGEYVVTLSDGSRVWMNSESEIRFPLQFSKDRRELSMSGEVFFQVSRDTSAPFLVHTRHGDIRVLGTSFNIRDYSDEKFLETTLVSGKVEFEKADGKFVLNPGEQLRMDRQTGKTAVSVVNALLYCSWKDGRFVFEKQRLEDIMTTVSRWYDIEVIYEQEELKNLLFTGNIRRYGELEPLLEMLKLVNKVDIMTEGNTVFIRHSKENR